MSIGLRETVKMIRGAYPGNEEVVKDVVHVEVWDYAMNRFAEGHSMTAIYEDAAAEMGIKSEEDSNRLLEIILRASREWTTILPGVMKVVMD